MQMIEETWRQRLMLLIAEYDSQAKFATVIERTPSQVSQWVNASKYSGSEKRRYMDRSTARYIEKKCGKPEGWMDQPVKSPFEAPNSLSVTGAGNDRQSDVNETQCTPISPMGEALASMYDRIPEAQVERRMEVFAALARLIHGSDVPIPATDSSDLDHKKPLA